MEIGTAGLSVDINEDIDMEPEESFILHQSYDFSQVSQFARSRSRQNKAKKCQFPPSDYA